jgi:hypothetical protein
MRKLQISTLSIRISAGLGITANKVCSQVPVAKAPTVVSTPSMPQTQYIDVKPLELVANPYKYNKRNIKIRAKFDKFATLGLDYPAALRKHEDYISFMIQRPDITNHNIPLSELKIFLKKDDAEKHIDLNTGDEIVFTGRVFSTALGDPWMDVHNLTVVNKVKKDDKQ